MRIGVLTRPDTEGLDRVQALGFRCIQWVAFAEGPCGLEHSNWQYYADRLKDEAGERGIGITAIGALYENPLEPAQGERARLIFERAFDVAARLGVEIVSGFAGAVVKTELNTRGGNPVYEPFESHIPEAVAFWSPLARRARDQGLKLAFEHCPQGPYHLPVMHYNMLGQPAMWERFFDACPEENVGLEWDPSHLVCQFIDPVENIRTFGRRIFHVHAKDARVNLPLLRRYGICHPDVAEHRFPGFGDSDWSEIIHELVRQGYRADLNVEGRHDPVLKNHDREGDGGGLQLLQEGELEDAGLVLARRFLERLVPGCGGDCG